MGEPPFFRSGHIGQEVVLTSLQNFLPNHFREFPFIYVQIHIILYKIGFIVCFILFPFTYLFQAITKCDMAWGVLGVRGEGKKENYKTLIWQFCADWHKRWAVVALLTSGGRVHLNIVHF